jgi:hypothetical protein
MLKPLNLLRRRPNEMSVKVSSRKLGGAVIADVGGAIETATDMDLLFDEATPRRVELNFVINMGRVKRIEPAAICQLRVRRQVVREKGGEVRLANVGNIKDPQVLWQLALACPIHESVADAIHSFR